MAIVYIDVDDEITSVAARIRRLPDTHIALVVPPGSRIATSRINFRLLAREAAGSARGLAIVTPDVAVRALASAAGLEAHASVADYEAAEAARVGQGAGGSGGGAPATGAGAGAIAAGRRDAGGAAGAPAEGSSGGGLRSGLPARGAASGSGSDAGASRGGSGAGESTAGTIGDGRTRPTTGLPAVASTASSGHRPYGGRRRWPWVVALVGIVTVLGAAGVLAYATLPTATVTIRPAAEKLGPIDLVVHADPAAAAVDVATATIPATSVEVAVEVGDTFDATGKKTQETKASGSVTFISKDPTRANLVPAGSIVRTAAGVGFATRTAVTIPKARIEGLTILPGTATVKVTALKGGPEANVAPNTISVVPPGEDPVLLGVQNRAPTAGGTRKTTTVVTQDDVDAALKTLDKRLKARFADTAADPARAPEGTVLVPDTALLGRAVADPAADALVGTEADTFDLSLSATGSVTAYAPAAARSLALARLAGQVPSGYSIVEGTATAVAGEATAVQTAADVPTTSSASVVRTIDEATVKSLVRGRTPVEAEAALAAYGDVTVAVWPGFLPSVTTTESRIEVRIEPITSAAPAGPTSSPPTVTQAPPSATASATAVP